MPWPASCWWWPPAPASTTDTTTKWVSVSVPPLMALWFRYVFQAVATTAVVLPLRGRSVWRTRRTAAPAARRPAAHQQPAGLRQPALPAGGRVHRHRDDHAAGDHAAGRHPAQGAGLAAALAAGGGRFRRFDHHLARAAAAFGWAACCRSRWSPATPWFQVLTSKLARTEDPVTMHLYTGWTGTLVASLALPFVWTSGPIPGCGPACASWACWGRSATSC